MIRAMSDKSVIFSIYLPKNLVDWIDEQASVERRSRNEYIKIVLEDLKEGKLAYRGGGAEKIEIKKTRILPLARV